MKVGYRRVSSLDQNLDRQELVGVEKVFEDKASGKDTNRTALNEMIALWKIYIKENNVIIDEDLNLGYSGSNSHFSY